MLKESICLLLFSIVVTSGMVCWECNHASSMRNCKLNGRMDTCRTGEGMCVTEVKKMGGGRMMVSKGCKQTHSCKVMRGQNNMMDGGKRKCNPSDKSSCCCCCGRKGCNKHMGMCGPRTKVIKPTKKPRIFNQLPRLPFRRPKKPTYFPKNVKPRCPPFDQNFPHGEIKCMPGMKGGMICDFSCTEEGFSLFPRHDSTLSCMRNGKWDLPKPCCAPTCEPPKYDVIGMVHAANDIMYAKMYQVIEIMLRRLGKQPGIRHAHLLFDSNVTFSQAFQEVQVEPGEQLDLIEQTPNVTGDGEVSLATALSFAHNNLRSSEAGNRDDVTDVILLATDRNPTDDYIAAAAPWLYEGAMIFVVAFPDEDNIYPDDQNLASITQEEHHIFLYLEDRHYDLAYEIADDLKEHSCVNPCIHGHIH